MAIIDTNPKPRKPTDLVDAMFINASERYKVIAEREYGTQVEIATLECLLGIFQLLREKDF